MSEPRAVANGSSTYSPSLKFYRLLGVAAQSSLDPVAAAHGSDTLARLMLFSQLLQTFLKVTSPALRQSFGRDGPSKQIDVFLVAAI